MTKTIFVTGGVVSGLGKGITAASLGRLLRQRGLRVGALKLDPYINIDPGTMSPFQHGEVFVTDDGAETDLDLGHYERFIDENLTKYSNITSGKVYWNVLNRERTGGYLGETIQVIPHITGEIKNFIYAAGTDRDVLIVEIGGTVGDIESQPILEAIRQISLEQGRENVLFIHVTLVPFEQGSGEHKSKPTQHSVKELRSLGIAPDIIVTRSGESIDKTVRQKIALFCNVKPDCVIENITLPCLYEAPLMLHNAGLDDVVCRGLGLTTPPPDLAEWRNLCDKINAKQGEITIALVGKYVKLHDAYLSVAEALSHAGIAHGTNVNILWVNSETITSENAAAELGGADGILIPGGFGERGVEGMIVACNYARTQKIPFLGICLGMHIAAIEFARYVCGLEGAHTREIDPQSPHLVIDLMEEQVGIVRKGGTMRLGAYPCVLQPGSNIRTLYGTAEISERHRHRYEFNNDYREVFAEHGMTISGVSPDGNLVETIELCADDGHPYFTAVQFHPEFLSRPNRPHPLFVGLVEAAMSTNNEQLTIDHGRDAVQRPFSS